jgi:hypothetical protein
MNGRLLTGSSPGEMPSKPIAAIYKPVALTGSGYRPRRVRGE